MADVYFGDRYTTRGDGNWNNQDNWFSSVAYFVYGPDYYISGTPLGRLPTEQDTVHLYCRVLSNAPSSWNGNLVLAAYEGDDASNSVNTVPNVPVGTWGGTITGGASYYIIPGGLGTVVSTITGGTFNGAVSLTNMQVTGGTFNNSFTLAREYGDGPSFINGGVFNGAVSFTGKAEPNPALWNATEGIRGGTFNSTVAVRNTVIQGGTFYGLLTPYVPAIGATRNGLTLIRGGTYSPAATVNLIKSNGLWIPDPATLPNDPGFAAGGGTFSPRLTLTGLPNILGAGLLL
jgi:hypothetical protein